jgi:hypothetical protein
MNDVTSLFKLTKTIDTIERLSGGGERRIWWEDIRIFLDLLTDGYLILGSSLNDGATFYRGRELFDNEPFSQLDQLTIKKSELVKSLGRCHKHHQQVLYASNNLETVFSELGLHVGNRVQIIKIEKIAGADVNFTVIGEIDHVRRYGKPAIVSEEFAQKIRDHWNSLDEIEKLRLNLTDAFISDKFRNPVKYQYEYKTTSAFSDILFSQGIDSFLYPSVGHLGGWNIAIQGKVFQEKFRVVESELTEIYDVLGYGIYGTVPLQKSKSINDEGAIEWDKDQPIKPIFRTFDEYLKYCISLPGIKTLFFQLLKFADNEFPNGHIEKKIPEIGKVPGLSGGIMKWIFDGYMPLNPNIEFNKLKQNIDSKNRDWDVIVIDIGKNIFNDKDANIFLSDMKKRLMSGDTGFIIFKRSGEPVAIMRSVSP